jgi:hypothetical protein
MLVRRAIAAALVRLSTIQIGVPKRTVHISLLGTHRPLLQVNDHACSGVEDMKSKSDSDGFSALQCLRGGFSRTNQKSFLSSTASNDTKGMSDLPKASDVLRFWYGGMVPYLRYLHHLHLLTI